MGSLNVSFESFIAPETYHRVDGKHPLDLYVGIDEHRRWTLLLVSDFEPQSVESSKLIYVQKRTRYDNRWTLSLSLVDDTYREIFQLFCGDIVESSRTITDKKKGVKFIRKRYQEWREMLANSRGDLLSPSEIKGLLGEMFFLQQFLAKTYGIEKAALSWTGPRKLPQDFIVDDTWYEVKTISSNKSEVRISSIEQLDSSNDGKLIVVNADKTSLTNERATNLNKLYLQIMEEIKDDSVKTEFSTLLLRFGYYPRAEYETADYTFEIKQIQQYKVTPSFPCLRRAAIPESIIAADYTISLPVILPFREE